MAEVKDASLGLCIESECKAKASRNSFCSEHEKQAKFGAIRMNGTRPTDHETKLRHYELSKSGPAAKRERGAAGRASYAARRSDV